MLEQPPQKRSKELETDKATTFLCRRCFFYLDIVAPTDAVDAAKQCRSANNDLAKILHVLPTLIEIVVGAPGRIATLKTQHERAIAEIERLFEPVLEYLELEKSREITLTLTRRESAARWRAAVAHRAELLAKTQKAFDKAQTDIEYHAADAEKALPLLHNSKEHIGTLTQLIATFAEDAPQIDLATVPQSLLLDLRASMCGALYHAHELAHAADPVPVWVPYVAAPKKITADTFACVSLGYSIDWPATIGNRTVKLISALPQVTIGWPLRDLPTGDVVANAPQHVSQAHVAPDGALWFTRHNPHGPLTRKLFRKDLNAKTTQCVRVGGKARVLSFVMGANGLAIVALGRLAGPSACRYSHTGRRPNGEDFSGRILVGLTTQRRVWETVFEEHLVPSSLTAINAREVAFHMRDLIDVHTYDVDSGAALRRITCAKSLLERTLPVLGTRAVIVLRYLSQDTKDFSTGEPIRIVDSEEEQCVRDWRTLLKPDAPDPVRPTWVCSNSPAHLLVSGDLRLPRPNGETAIFHILAKPNAQSTAVDSLEAQWAKLKPNT